MKLTQILTAASISLLALTIQAQAIIAFDAPKKAAQKCALIEAGETITLDVYIYPDYPGVHYEGPMTGWTSTGLPVSAYGKVTVRRGVTVSLDWMTIADACDVGRVKARATAFPFAR